MIWQPSLTFLISMATLHQTIYAFDQGVTKALKPVEKIISYNVDEHIPELSGSGIEITSSSQSEKSGPRKRGRGILFP